MKISLGFIAILIVLAMSMFAGMNVKNVDIEDGVDRNVYEYSNTIFKYNESTFSTTQQYNKNNSVTTHINNIVMKQLEALTYSVFEIGKIGVELGYDSNEPHETQSLAHTIKIILILLLISISIYPILIMVVCFNELYKYIKSKF